MNITRYQLIGFGASKYQAEQLTKGCEKQGKEGRAALYRLANIIQAVEERLENKRIKQTTRKALEQLLQSLQSLSSNLIPLPFGATETETTDAVKQLIKSANNPQTLKHRMKAAEIKGKKLSNVK